MTRGHHLHPPGGISHWCAHSFVSIPPSFILHSRSLNPRPISGPYLCYTPVPMPDLYSFNLSFVFQQCLLDTRSFLHIFNSLNLQSYLQTFTPLASGLWLLSSSAFPRLILLHPFLRFQQFCYTSWCPHSFVSPQLFHLHPWHSVILTTIPHFALDWFIDLHPYHSQYHFPLTSSISPSFHHAYLCYDLQTSQPDYEHRLWPSFHLYLSFTSIFSVTTERLMSTLDYYSCFVLSSLQ